MIEKIVYHIKHGGVRELFASTQRFFLIKASPFIMRFFEMFEPKNKIVFSHFDGKAYGGNPGIICDEIIRKGLPYELVWISDLMYKETIPKSVKWVQTYSIKQLWNLATAKIWIDDCRKASCIRKNKKQYYIQTWHGGGPCLKKIEKDAVDSLSESYLKDAKNDSVMVDLFISGCKWRTNNYKTAFWYDGEIIECGTPTADIFSRDILSIKKNVYEAYNLNYKKLALYAPTFRNSHDVECYRMDYKRTIKTLADRFNGEWCLIVRLHPSIMNLSDFIIYDDKVINGSAYPRFEDLLISSDILITDYSGCMFDAYALKKIVFIYATDLDKYQREERGFYFDLNNLPASVSRSTIELQKNILEFNNDDYLRRVSNFIDKIGYVPFGKATEEVIERIIKVMEAQKS